jgi:hypothetical protein
MTSAGNCAPHPLLRYIVTRMHEFVRPEYPRIPNPADPAEDYADKWRKDLSLEDNFWKWLSQVKSDLATHARTR